MPYAGSVPVHDADSHLMEWPGWLRSHADVEVRDSLPLLDLHGMEAVSEAAMRAVAASEPDPSAVLTLRNWDALGAFDPSERTRALDLLGFRSQLVFSTYSHLPLMNIPPGGGIADLELLDSAVRAHNRGVVEFCSADPRLLPVGWVSLDDSTLAACSAENALEAGCAAIEVPSFPIGPKSLTHVDFEPIYSMLEDARRPLLFHVGGGGRLASPVFANDGRERRQERQGHSPMLPALTFLGIPAPVEMAVAALVLDGVFERHPGLMCGVIEQGATWVPGWLRRLDLAVEEFGDSSKTGLSLWPSEYVRRHVRFTPFHYEDVRWLIDQTSPDLYMFSTDYPHDEGSDQPLEQFVQHFDEQSHVELGRFLYANFEELMGDGLPQALRIRHDDERATVA
jgi:uncharacterized protein